jgi:cell division septation protein DedD
LVDGSGQPIRLLGVNKAGTEYACVQGWGFFDGPSDAASVRAIAGWRANAVRVPLNESCWLGINGVSPTYGGANYQKAIRDYVDLLNQQGLVAILELHWSAAGGDPATGQQPMPNRDHTPTFWSQVATAYKDRGGVVFDLFNEPYPDNNRDTAEAWRCWRDGGACAGVPFQAAGMQELVDAVRAAGAANLILLGGVQYANTLSRWLDNKPRDPAGNIAASWHVYNFNRCNSLTCYEQEVAPVAQQVPLIAGEIGEDDCGHSFIDPLMGWLDARGASYLAWTWNTWGGCRPVLISDYSGTPTAYGQGFRDHLAAIVAAPPSPSPSPSPSGPLPVISRGAPAYASGGTLATYANDADYATVWRSMAAPSVDAPQWLTYDLSSVPAANRDKVLLAWYNDVTGPYWQDAGGTFYSQPRDYTIEAAAGPSGAPPASGWVTLTAVAGNTYSGRAHSLNLGDFTWVRLRVTATRGGTGNDDVAIQLDVHDASAQVDNWLFLGDSLTLEGLRHANITGMAWTGGNLAQLVGEATQGARFPATVNGGVGGTTMAWAAQHIESLLAPFPGRYVAVSYGTNDANTGGPLSDAQVAAYYQSLLVVVDAIQARGLVAVVPSTLWGCASNGWLGTNARLLNAHVAAHLWTDRPGVLRGPDLWSYFQQHPDLLRDCLHPTYVADAGQLNGYEQYQRLWAGTVASVALGSAPPSPSSSPASTPTPTAIPSATALPTQTATATPTPAPGKKPAPKKTSTPPKTPTTTSTAADTTTVTAPEGLTLYDSGMRNGFSDGSFGFSARNACDPVTFASAPCAYTIAYTAWGGLNFLAVPGGFDTTPYGGLVWMMRTNGAPITSFSALLTDNTSGRTVIREIVLAPGDATAVLGDGWVRVAIPIARLNPENVAISSIQIKNATAASLAPITIDDVRLTLP